MSHTLVNRRVAVALLGFLLTTVAWPSAQTSTTPDIAAAMREYPSYDGQLAGRVSRGLGAIELDRKLAADPTAPEVFRGLVNSQRLDEALGVLDGLAGREPANLVQMVGAIRNEVSDFAREANPDRLNRLLSILEPVAARVPSLPRETAAPLVFQLAAIESQVRRRFRADATRMAADYADARQEAVPDVSRIPFSIRGSRSQLDAYDRVAAQYPGTAVAARALATKANHLAHNSSFLTDYPVADRFVDLAALVADLESGKYPPGSLPTPPASYLTGFYMPENVVIPPADRPRVVAALTTFIQRHAADRRTEDFYDSSLFYLIRSKMARMVRPDDEVAGIEEIVRGLEPYGLTRPEIEFTLASHYMHESTAGPAPEGPAMREKARAAFARLADSGRDYHARKALATLAAMWFYDQNAERARQLYQQYAARYPDSPWTWVAEWRAAQTFEEAGDTKAATTAYRRVAERFANQPVARVLAWNAVGRLFENAGDLREAAGAYRRAIDGWDPRFGAELWDSPSRLPVGTTATLAAMWDRVTREGLTHRVANLDAALAIPGGRDLALGRSLVERDLYPEASATLSKFLAANPKSPAAAEARTLMHRAQFGHALNLANLHRADHNETESLVVLNGLAKEPVDFWVTAGELVRAILELRKEQPVTASRTTEAALERLLAAQRPTLVDSSPDPLAADVLAIRAELFRPAGDHALLGRDSWSAFRRSRPGYPFWLTHTGVAVKEAGGRARAISLRQTFPASDKVIFLDGTEGGALSEILLYLGGDERRRPTGIMEVPNQPVGAARDIATFWSQFFPIEPGHWGGWVTATYPIISEIEFFDAARTRAGVKITIGYEGATVQMEKVDGRWKATGLTNRWIT